MGTRPAPRRRGAPLLQTPLDPSNEPRIRRRLGWIVALVALPCAFVFHFWPHVHTANESIRLYFTQALLEGTAPAIDAVSAQQGAAPIDRATYEGRSYLDKAPGLSLLALPVVATLRAIGVPSTGRNLWIHGLFSTILCVTLPLTLAWIALCLALRRRARSASAAAFTTLGLALGSPLFVYATLLFGHATATACILGAWLLLSRWPDGVSTPRQAWLGGLLAGLAVLIETTTMPLAGALVAMVWLRSREPPRRRLVLAMPALGGLAFGVGLQLIYNTWLFSDPLHFAYASKADPGFAAIHAHGLLGVGLPSWDALVGLLVSSKRGLVYVAPWTAFALCGLCIDALRADTARGRSDARWNLALFTLHVLVVAGFADWPAGDAFGPRHLLPALPLLAPGFASLWDRAGSRRPVARGLLAALVAMGVLCAAPTALTWPYHFADLDNPLTELSWPFLLDGLLSPTLGRLAGLPETASLALFTVLVALPFGLAARAFREPEPVRHVLRRGFVRSGATVAALLAWLVLMVEGAQNEPGSGVIGARWKAYRMMGGSEVRKAERARRL